jgi:hypothetical protein
MFARQRQITLHIVVKIQKKTLEKISPPKWQGLFSAKHSLLTVVSPPVTLSRRQWWSDVSNGSQVTLG